jgi:hypothetical protein
MGGLTRASFPELPATEVTAAFGNKGANAAGDQSYTGHELAGLTLPAFVLPARPTRLRLYFPLVQIGNTFAIPTFQICSTDEATSYMERWLWPAAAANVQLPFMALSKRLTPGTSMPGLKVRWKLNLNALNAFGFGAQTDSLYGVLQYVYDA